MLTRASAKWLDSHKYDKVCRVKILRRANLDRLAFERPTALTIRRHRSMQNLSKPGTSQSSQQQLIPKLDMAKIRSILKKPNDKPVSIFGRRKSMSDARVSFAPANDEENDSSVRSPTIDEVSMGDSSNSVVSTPAAANSNPGPNVTSSNDAVDAAQLSQSITIPDTMPLISSRSGPQTVQARTSNPRPTPSLIPAQFNPPQTSSSQMPFVIATAPQRPLPNLFRILSTQQQTPSASRTPMIISTSPQRPLPNLIPVQLTPRQATPQRQLPNLVPIQSTPTQTSSSSRTSLVISTTPQYLLPTPTLYSNQQMNRANAMGNPNSPELDPDQGPSGVHDIRFGQLRYDTDSD